MQFSLLALFTLTVCNFYLANCKMGGPQLHAFNFFFWNTPSERSRLSSSVASFHPITNNELQDSTFHTLPRGLALNLCKFNSFLLSPYKEGWYGYLTFANRLKQPSLLTIQCTSGSLFPFPLGLKTNTVSFVTKQLMRDIYDSIKYSNIWCLNRVQSCPCRLSVLCITIQNI